jgi:hypothetical protein
MTPKPLLDGIRVLDLGRFIAAPYAGQLLADLGAEVVRVERPKPEPDRLRGPHLNADSMYFVTINRHKTTVTRSPPPSTCLTKRAGGCSISSSSRPTSSSRTTRRTSRSTSDSPGSGCSASTRA